MVRTTSYIYTSICIHNYTYSVYSTTGDRYKVETISKTQNVSTLFIIVINGRQTKSKLTYLKIARS